MGKANLRWAPEGGKLAKISYNPLQIKVFHVQNDVGASINRIAFRVQSLECDQW